MVVAFSDRHCMISPMRSHARHTALRTVKTEPKVCSETGFAVGNHFKWFLFQTSLHTHFHFCIVFDDFFCQITVKARNKKARTVRLILRQVNLLSHSIQKYCAISPNLSSSNWDRKYHSTPLSKFSCNIIFCFLVLCSRNIFVSLNLDQIPI